jgi:hypothetical protein
VPQRPSATPNRSETPVFQSQLLDHSVHHSPNSTRFGTRLVAPLAVLFLLLPLCVAPLYGQSRVRVSVAEENVRAEPSGARIAVVNRDFRFTPGETRGQWRAVTLDGWVPARTVIVNRRDGFNIVIAGSGAPLHQEPGGSAGGQVSGGVQLNEITRQNGWVRVQRRAWIWAPSIAAAAAEAPAEAPARAAAAAPRAASPAVTPASPAAASPGPAVAAADAPASPATAVPPLRTLHASPRGDTLARLAPAARLEVLGREGGWARVRVEGWIPAGAAGELSQPAALRDLSLQALRSEPDRYRGVSVQWQIQFMALQRADSVRTDFERGEPYILARDPGGEPGFVYIAVPADQLAAVRRLSPLERVEVVARVRNGRSPLTGHPVLELLELRR